MTNISTIDVVEGDDVTLLCQYNSLADFDLHWYKKNNTTFVKIWTYSSKITAVSEQDKPLKGFNSSLERARPELPVTQGHSIKIKNVSQQDEAGYLCELELDNGARKGSASTTVNVLSKCCCKILPILLNIFHI